MIPIVGIVEEHRRWKTIVEMPRILKSDTFVTDTERTIGCLARIQSMWFHLDDSSKTRKKKARPRNGQMARDHVENFSFFIHPHLVTFTFFKIVIRRFRISSFFGVVFFFAFPICGHVCVWFFLSGCAICVSVTTTVCIRSKLYILELLVRRVQGENQERRRARFSQVWGAPRASRGDDGRN